MADHPLPPTAAVIEAPPRREARPPGPCAMVIFGAGGDLTRRLLVPALYNLARTGLLPEHFALVGVDLAVTTPAAWAGELHDMLQGFVGNRTSEDRIEAIDATVWQRLAGAMSTVQGDLNDPGLFQRLKDHLHGLTHSRGTGGNCLFYLAVADRFFAPVAEGLGAAGLLAQPDEKGSAVAAAGDREAVRPRHRLRPRPQPPAAQHPGRGADLPDRPFPRQGDGAEHHGVPVRQRAVRADLEPRPHRPRADHGRRAARRGTPRQVLRSHRRAARHGAQPRVPGAGHGGDGAARRLRRRADPQPQGRRVRPAAQPDPGGRGARPVRTGHDRRP